MKRRAFLYQSAAAGSLAFLNPLGVAAATSAAKDFPVVRVPAAERNFSSEAIEAAIREFSEHVADPELTWLFHNCFPNTLDTTVTYTEPDGKPDTYVITGDIDAMWLRDSSAQVWPYLQFADQDEKLRKLIAGVINRQTAYVRQDPYANAFYDDPEKRGEWQSDMTDMQAGVHERKYEIDSLCYPIRLGYHYWKTTGDTAPFGADWQQAMHSILTVFREQQQKDGTGPYRFMRTTPHATDTRSLRGYGYPVNPVGLICSAFRPSDDATVFSFLVPSNFFAVISLRQAAEMLDALAEDAATATAMRSLAEEVEQALHDYAIVEHEKYGQIYAFEVDGFGNRLMMDDANVPSLLSLPYLDAVGTDDPVYQNTRAFVWSTDNPFFFRGEAAEGIGGPHVGMDFIWPMAITMRGLTSTSDDEIRACIQSLKATHGGTGFMHEGFHKDDPENFTRSWFAWANTLFGEFLWKTYQENPALLT